MTINNETPTRGIVHAGFRGIRRFVARKINQYTLIGNCSAIPYGTYPAVILHDIFDV